MKILLVDDDRELVDVVAFALRRAGFEVLPAYDPRSALQLFARERPDLAILDVNLGSSSGFDLLEELRQGSDIPVIMLTGRDAEGDKVLGLELGADDYVVKPFSQRELTARVRARLRRHPEGRSPGGPPQTRLTVGPLSLDLAQHSTTIDGRQLDLTVTEFRLLHYLMSNAGTVVPTRDILKHVWGFDDPGGTDVIRVTLYRLRRKLGDDSNGPRLLHTVPSVGVMLKSQPS